MPDIDQLLIPIEVDTWRDEQLDWATDLGLPTTAWRAQTPERVLIEINARALNLLGGTVYEGAIRGGFLTYARGEWLSLLSEDTYQTPRKAATFASCTVQFTNAGSTPYSIPSGDRIIVKKGGTDITYRVDGPFTIPSLGSSPLLTAVAEVAGSAGSADVGDINELQDALPGPVTVTNTTTAVGLDEELDDALRARARLATGPLSPAGAAAAYEYVATTMLRLDGQPVDVTKVLIIEDENDGSVTAYYASASGPSSDVGLNINPAPGEVNYEIRRAVVPNGIAYSGFSAIQLSASITYTAAVRSSVLQQLGLTLDEVKDRINTYVENYVASVDMPIHGFPLTSVVPGFVGIWPAQDQAEMIGEAVRLNSDIESGIAGQKPVYAITVSSGDILFALGEVLKLVSPGVGIRPVDGTLTEF